MDWAVVIPSILTVGLALAMLIAGGCIGRLRKESGEFIDVIRAALKDDVITPEEWQELLREGKDVQDSIVEILHAVCVGRGKGGRPFHSTH